jgi:hypothetical protein
METQAAWRAGGRTAEGTLSFVTVAVLIEEGSKRVFASAVDWPGWSRSGRSEGDALAALGDYRSRYAAVLDACCLLFKAAGSFDVIERVPGDATTDFGAPGVVAEADRRAVTVTQGKKLVAILQACWGALDVGVAGAQGRFLRTGPRGGGRLLPAIAEHVLESETSYLRRIAVTPPKLDSGDPSAAGIERRAVIEGVEKAVREGLPETGPRGGVIWPVRYFIRRAAWHVLDHRWEIEDRLP